MTPSRPTPVTNAKTSSWGNLGIAPNAAAAPGSPATPASVNGYLQVTNGMNFPILGTRNGKERQSIVFSVFATSAYPLLLSDENGNPFMDIPAGAQIALASDSLFFVSGVGGTCQVRIGQIFSR